MPRAALHRVHKAIRARPVVWQWSSTRRPTSSHTAQAPACSATARASSSFLSLPLYPAMRLAALLLSERPGFLAASAWRRITAPAQSALHVVPLPHGFPHSLHARRLAMLDSCRASAHASLHVRLPLLRNKAPHCTQGTGGLHARARTHASAPHVERLAKHCLPHLHARLLARARMVSARRACSALHVARLGKAAKPHQHTLYLGRIHLSSTPRSRAPVVRAPNYRH